MRKLGSREIEEFKNHFQDYHESYILIGGSACQILLGNAGFDFRTTKDLDIVLCVETLSADFVNHFWSYIKKGKYRIAMKASGKRCFYRFDKPEEENFPDMIELLSPLPDIFRDVQGQIVVPMTVGEEVVSLSAIILNQEYYNFMISLKISINGIPLADHRVIIPLKARAYLDLKSRKRKKENVKNSDIKKHKYDIFRISRLLVNERIENVPDVIREDMSLFVTDIIENDLVLKQLGIVDLSMQEIKDLLITVYGL